MIANETSQIRAMVYELFSSLFAKELNCQTLGKLCTLEARLFWGQLGSEPKFTDAVNELLFAIDKLQTNDDLLELAADYCGLFLMNGKHGAAPYAGFYNGSPESPELFNEQHQQMMTFLQESHLQVQGDFPEPADHISVILAYVGHLCRHHGEQQQRQFLLSHLDSWLAAFVARVEQHDPGQFYRALARLTLAWTREDIAGLSESRS